jgi:hypothetical protein
MIHAIRDVAKLRLEDDDCQLREPLNRIWDTPHHILDVRKAFNFFNGCDMRWPGFPEDLSIASFARDRWRVESLSRLART